MRKSPAGALPTWYSARPGTSFPTPARCAGSVSANRWIPRTCCCDCLPIFARAASYRDARAWPLASPRLPNCDGEEGMETGYLLIANNVATGAVPEFESWYQQEHLPERLGVPGFRKAWRYQAIQGNPRYIAIYETVSTQVLDSAAYLERLASPSERTRAIMPHFRDMSRTVMSRAYHRARGLGGVLAVLFLEPAA